MKAIKEFLKQANEMIEGNPHLYVEIARTRPTEWMAWICTDNRQRNTDREVIVYGQGQSADDACNDALRNLYES